MSSFSMKRALIASGLAIGTALAFAPATMAQPLDDTADSGEFTFNNPEFAEIAYTSIESSFTLGAGSNFGGLAKSTLGTVNIKSNGPTGYVVKVESTNNGRALLEIDETDYFIPYTLTYEGTGTTEATVAAGGVGSQTWGAGPHNLENKTSFYAAAATTAGVDRTVSISVAAGAQSEKPAGAYKDTLIFTLTNNQ